ncbi:MAG: hypothetical protein ONB23_12875 [candidate division KSB1 bacterium]|nr:hypothetical protein [candidate division KSB1 bacterium]
MRRHRVPWLATVAIALGLACAARLKLVSAKAEPVVLSPGQKGRIEVAFAGAKARVGSVQAVVREYPEYTIRLNDEGRMGDAVAGDGIWSYEFPVPFDAPAQKYHVDIVVKDKAGKVLKLGKAETGPAATIVVEVR